MKLQDPSSLPRGARRFVAYWLQDIAFSFEKRGFGSLIPIRLLICAGIATAITYKVDPKFLNDRASCIALYAAILTLNAILLAICWGAFAKIFDAMSDPKFGKWLRRRNMDGYYGFYIEFIQLTQMLALSIATFSLAFSIMEYIPTIVSKTLLGMTFGSTLYAGIWSSGGVRVMQDLSDYRSKFLDSPDDISDIGKEERRI